MPSNKKRRLAVDVAIIVFLLLPVLLNRALAFTDIANHTHRATQLSLLIQGIPLKAHQIEFKLIPNMPIDILSITLGRIISTDILIPVLMAIGIVGLYLTVLIWRYRCGRSTSLWLRSMIALSIFSLPISYGLLNYTLSLPLLNLMLMNSERFWQSRAIIASPNPCKIGWTNNILYILSFHFSAFACLIYSACDYAMALSVQVINRKTIVSNGSLKAITTKAFTAGRMWITRNWVGLVVVGFCLVNYQTADPLAPRFAFTIWTKIRSIFSVAILGDSPAEYAMSMLYLLVLIASLIAGRISMTHIQSYVMSALLVLICITPGTFLGATLSDSRLGLPLVICFLALCNEKNCDRSVYLPRS